MNRRLGRLLRKGLSKAGLEVTRVGRGAGGNPTYSISEGLITQYLCLGEASRVAVDIAAADGKSGSNTYALFRAGWQGLAVEATPAVFTRRASITATLPRSPSTAGG